MVLEAPFKYEMGIYQRQQRKYFSQVVYLNRLLINLAGNFRRPFKQPLPPFKLG